MSRNREVARVLSELALLTELDEGSPQAFRVRAYDNAARAVDGLATDVASMSPSQLVATKGIGKSTAQKIGEYLESGKIAKLERLRELFPPAYVELTRIPGLGPKRVAVLHEELGIGSVDDLRQAIEQQALRALAGFGPKSEEKLIQAIERLGLSGKERRTPIEHALPVAREIVAALASVEGVESIEYAGSLRRFRETIGDIDILVAARDRNAVMAEFLDLAVVKDVLGKGETKSSVVTHGGMQVDLRVVDPDQYGAALLYFTGSKAHNIRLRQLALERDWTLNEYALSEVESGKVVASKTEETIYEALGVSFIEPPLREDTGEIEAAQDGTLPDLVHLDDIKGDLHVHTDLSGDGHATLEDMLDALAARGMAYVGITDHGEDLRINGASRGQMLAQRKRIAGLANQYEGMRILHGCELNIDREGNLDYDHDFLMGFDWCVASVHSLFDLDRDAQTRRVLAAIRHPAVNAIGHLTGRQIGSRPDIELDIDQVIEAAVATGTALEVNCHLRRLDVAPEVARRATEAGAYLVISTDAHTVRELDQMRWGVLNAERGWVDKSRVVNTWPADQFLNWVGAKRTMYAGTTAEPDLEGL
ncbi:MAG: DNA polymerase/3'-5' exonuclease PolX [Acidimicrobiia bacterium]|nr:DNA polymerase/3'-5' exonuclease PolX [Acidimicrobiia bacterium]